MFSKQLPSSGVSTIRLLNLLVLLGVMAGGCAFGNFRGVTVRSRVVKTANSAGGTSNSYLAFRARRRAKNGHGFIQVPRNLWAPFRFEVTGGLFHLLRTNLETGIFYVELQIGALSPSYNISAEQVTGGLKLTAHRRDGQEDPVAVGELTLEGTTIVDFALDHDGQSLHFLARPTGEGTYRTIATIPFSDQRVPLRPTVGVDGIGHGAEVGFDNYRLVRNGNSPLPLSAAQRAMLTIFESADLQVEVLHALDGPAPDLLALETQLLDSVIPLEAAESAVRNLPWSRNTAKARKRLSKAKKKLLSAIRKLERNAAVAGAKKRIRGALELQGLAVIDLSIPSIDLPPINFPPIGRRHTK